MKVKDWPLIGIAVSTTTGIAFRLLFGVPVLMHWLQVMSLGFLFFMPLLMGFITIYLAEKKRIRSSTYAIFLPWIPIVLLLIVTLVLSIEGWGCWIMAMPIFLIAASFGGWLAHLLQKRNHKKRNNLQLSLLLMLPFLISSVEHFIGNSTKSYRAYTEIEIIAPKEVIWNNVTRVRPIKQQQDSAWFTRFIGLPRPIRAELDTDAVGGKRKAIFDKGLIFDERVIAYQPFSLMTFTIHASPYTIPSTTMDEHIVVGGDFFDVLNGTYQLQPEANNHYKLRLYSNFKLTTTFNFYADIWAGWIMKDIQNNILKIIKQRSESNT